MPCPDDNELAAFTEGTLSAEARKALERHIDGCSTCREILSDVVVGVTRRERLEDDDGGETLQTPDASMPDVLMKGEMVDHFCVLHELGAGGMGRVYLARDVKLARRVALKLIQPELAGSERVVRMFRREARAMARISHPNIVTVHSVGDHRGLPYVALEYVPGDTLRERYQSRAAELADGLRIAVGLGEGLAEAHRHGIVHRDLKPSNVILGRENRPRIVDFGLADFVESRGQSATTTDAATLLDTAHTSPNDGGTPSYMAPEQWRGEDVTGATDVWALGVILWEIFSGERLFQGKSEVDLVGQICGGTKLPPLRSKVSVPLEVGLIVDACLSRPPADRPTATEVADALRSSLERLELAPIIVVEQDAPTLPIQSAPPESEAVFAARDRSQTPGALGDIPHSAHDRASHRLAIVAVVAILGLGAVLIWIGTSQNRPSSPPSAATPPLSRLPTGSPPSANTEPTPSAMPSKSKPSAAPSSAGIPPRPVPWRPPSKKTADPPPPPPGGIEDR